MSTIGFAMCGSFCTLSDAMELMKELNKDYSILPIMSDNTYNTDTRFGTAKGFIEQAEDISGKKMIHTIVEAEPIGPKALVDLMLVSPCTGNTLSKIANGITDTSVTMAVKSALRIGTPVVLCIATKDALGASGQNIAKLMNTKNIYFVPVKQDNPEKKPMSLIADFSFVKDTIKKAVKGEQIQPVFL